MIQIKSFDNADLQSLHLRTTVQINIKILD